MWRWRRRISLSLEMSNPFSVALLICRLLLIYILSREENFSYVLLHFSMMAIPKRFYECNSCRPLVTKWFFSCLILLGFLMSSSGFLEETSSISSWTCVLLDGRHVHWPLVTVSTGGQCVCVQLCALIIRNIVRRRSIVMLRCCWCVCVCVCVMYVYVFLVFVLMHCTFIAAHIACYNHSPNGTWVIKTVFSPSLLHIVHLNLSKFSPGYILLLYVLFLVVYA